MSKLKLKFYSKNQIYIFVLTLKNELLRLMRTARNQTEEDEEGFANGLADIIYAYVKTGTVTVEAGISLMAGAYTGKTTGTGTGSIF